MYIGLPVKYPLFFSDINAIYIFSPGLKNPQIPNIMKICPKGVEFFMRTDRET